MNITLEDLLSRVKTYHDDDLSCVINAYDYAFNMHLGQFRESGEPYITHPLNVAYILSTMHADINTICAALLHDTLEDTVATKYEIEKLFNSEVAELVDGVTKISKMNFISKQEQNLANTRKIITGITTDVRIIIIKLADRLHNMRTLSFKTSYKQKENSIETLEIFVPLAYLIGAYRIKTELEDISFKYLLPEKYREIEYEMLSNEMQYKKILNDIYFTIDEILTNELICHEIKIRTKNYYSIYKKRKRGCKMDEIHDLLALKVMVDSVKNCYLTLGHVHSKYHPLQSKIKDYLYNPKTNMYRSLHTTVFGPNDTLVQTQIRTFDMDKVASFGISTYWDLKKGNARDEMQEVLKKQFQFLPSLMTINDRFPDNYQFVESVKKEIFADKVYVYNSKGDIVELPKSSTIIDYAYKLGIDYGNHFLKAMVNNQEVGYDYVLKNNDRVIIFVDNLISGPKKQWLAKAKTSYARQKIKEYL